MKHSSENTVSAYIRDLTKLENFMKEQGKNSVEEITATNLTTYVLYLEKQGLSTATISRSIASIRAFFMYLLRQGRISQDPSERLKPPKVEEDTGNLNDRRGKSFTGTAKRKQCKRAAG